jgi:hypothetical protein
VLSRVRKLALATAAGLPVTVGSAAQATLTLTFAGCLSDVSSLTHTRIRVSVYSTTLATDAGGQTFINIESANLQAGSAKQVVQPCFTGSALGALNAAALQGSLEFDTDDLSQAGLAAPANVIIAIVANNSDSSGHNVTSASATVCIEATQYADAYRGSVE